MQEDTTAIKAKGIVKSVQRGNYVETKDMSAAKDVIFTIPISPIDVSKSVLSFFRLYESHLISSEQDYINSVELTPNAIEITAQMVGAGSTNGRVEASWQVIEFY